jgi:molybdate transport system regulatory protein
MKEHSSAEYTCEKSSSQKIVRGFMEIKYQFWLEDKGEVVLSKACEDLLRGIDELHSLYAVTKLLNKSYRAAWGKIRTSEKLLGFRLVESKGPGKNLHLTEEAKAVLEIIDKLEENTEAFINWYWKNPDFNGNLSLITNSSKTNSHEKVSAPDDMHSEKNGSMTKKKASDTAR